MWSFVANKKNKQWVWLARLCRDKRNCRIYVGERNRNGALMLTGIVTRTQARQCAVCYTDFWTAYNDHFSSSCGIELLVRKVAKLI